MELAIGNEGEKNSVRSDIGMKMGAAGGWGEFLSAGRSELRSRETDCGCVQPPRRFPVP